MQGFKKDIDTEGIDECACDDEQYPDAFVPYTGAFEPVGIVQGFFLFLLPERLFS